MNKLIKNISPFQLSKILAESDTFRNVVAAYIYDKELETTGHKLHNDILFAMENARTLECRQINKTTLIKSINTLSNNRAEEFITAFPTIVNRESFVGYSDGSYVLGLSSSRKLAEHYIAKYA